MPWARRGFGGSEVWVRVDANGRVRVDARGRAEMRYRMPTAHGDAKVYRPALRNLTDPPPAAPGTPELIADPPREPPVAQADAIFVWTDGACTGNPGPMGIGVVILDGPRRREHAEFLGQGTNNIAELTAILRALELVGDTGRDRPVVVHSDSSYAIGLLSQGWKPKANQELVATLRDRVRKFAKLRFVKVAGHAGVPENERCDELARTAILEGARVGEQRGR